jgi:Arc/MetJ-type ribon-helix-helix transcriptional regulator
MSQRCTVRLPDMLYEFLQIEAEARQCGVSDLIREGLERLLGIEADHSAQLPKAPEPVTISAPTPHDCGQTVLAQLLPDVRTRIVETASLLNMSVLHIIRSLLIAQPWPKDQAAPQVPQAALSDTALSSAAPIPGTSS